MGDGTHIIPLIKIQTQTYVLLYLPNNIKDCAYKQTNTIQKQRFLIMFGNAIPIPSPSPRNTILKHACDFGIYLLLFNERCNGKQRSQQIK